MSLFTRFWHVTVMESTGTKPSNPWLRRFSPVTRKTPATLSKVTPGHIRMSRVSNLLSNALPVRRVAERTGGRQGAYPTAPQARSTWVSSIFLVPWVSSTLGVLGSSGVYGMSTGRLPLRGLLVK